MEKEMIIELEDILAYHRIQIEDIQEPYEVLRHMHYVDVLEDTINRLKDELREVSKFY